MDEEGEDGKIPKSMRHWTPLRYPKRRGPSEQDAVSGIVASIGTGEIDIEIFRSLRDKNTYMKIRVFADPFA